MTNSVIAIAARFSRRVPQQVPEPEEVIGPRRDPNEVLLPENDLEFLAREIERLRNIRVAAEGAKMRADIAAEQAAAAHCKSIDDYEAAVTERGLLCRK